MPGGFVSELLSAVATQRSVQMSIPASKSRRAVLCGDEGRRIGVAMSDGRRVLAWMPDDVLVRGSDAEPQSRPALRALYASRTQISSSFRCRAPQGRLAVSVPWWNGARSFQREQANASELPLVCTCSLSCTPSVPSPGERLAIKRYVRFNARAWKGMTGYRAENRAFIQGRSTLKHGYGVNDNTEAGGRAASVGPFDGDHA